MSRINLLEQVNLEAVLAKAMSRGGEYADIFAEEKTTTLIEIEAERVERLVQGSRSGAGVRTIHDHRVAYSYTDSVEKSSLLDCAFVASRAVKGGKSVNSPAKAGAWRNERMKVLEPPSLVSIPDKLEILWKAEKAARKADKRIVQVRVLFSDQTRSIAVADSGGGRTADSSTYIVFYVIAVAGDESGIQVAHEALGGNSGMEIFKERGPEELAVRAALRAAAALEARPAPAGAMPVVLSSEAGGTMVHEAVGHGLEADLAEQGLSVYQDMIGQRVGSDLVTVVDDATLPGKRGSFNFDDEGTPAQRTVLVEKGILKTFMYDYRMAAKTGSQSTGNGRRESYMYPPIARMTNTIIEPGQSDPASILKSVDKGLLVLRMGGGEVNTVNGDFVFEVEEGYMIEAGEKGEPVRGATLTGNGPRVLMDIDMVGSDLGFGIGTCGKDGQGAPVSDAQPTLRIPEIIVGGRLEE